MPVSQFSFNTSVGVRPAGVSGHELRAAQQRQPRLLARVRLRAVRQGVDRPDATASRNTRRCRRRGPPIRCPRTPWRSSTTRRSSSTTRGATGPTTAPIASTRSTRSIDLMELIPKTDIKVAYDYSRAESTYTYGLAPNTVIAAPVQLTPVLNELQRGTHRRPATS